MQALRYAAAAVMAAIIAPPLFFAVGAPTIDPDLPRSGAAVLAALVAWRTHSTLLTVALGMLAMWGLQTLPGWPEHNLGISSTMLTEEQINQTRSTLHELHIEHHDLDQVIDHLMLSPPPDDLLVRRLKKRKLLLKDRITMLEHMLEPDALA